MKITESNFKSISYGWPYKEYFMGKHTWEKSIDNLIDNFIQF